MIEPGEAHRSGGPSASIGVSAYVSSYSTPRQLVILSGHSLAALDSNGYSDPYVNVVVKGARKTHVHRTKTIRKSLDPTWNEQFDSDNMCADAL